MEENIRSRLNKFLQEKGWTRYRLSKESGIPLSTIYNIFNKDVDISFDTVDKLANVVGSVSYLYGTKTNA